MSIIADIGSFAVSSLAGGLGGGILRMIPEVLHLFRDAADRKHELAMEELRQKGVRDQGAQAMRQADLDGQIQIDAKGMDAWVEAIKAQGQRSGIKIADALSALVRPITTYYWLFLFGCMKAAIFYVTVSNGAGISQAVIQAWTPDDQAIFAGLLNFWFVGRVFENRRRA